MKKLRVWLLILLAFLAFAPNIAAQAIRQQGRHTFVINMGSWSVSNNTSASVTQAVDTRTGGFVGTFSHRYWLSDNWAVGPFVSLFELGEVSESESAQMTAILFSVTYSFPASAAFPNSRFYLSAGFGPYMSSTIEGTSENGMTEESMAVATFGMRPMAGMDWYFGNWFLFNMAFSYHLMPDFSEPVGTISNFSGAELSMGIGVTL